METLIKKIDYDKLYDDSLDIVTNSELILNNYMLYYTNTVYYFEKGRKSIHTSIYDQLTITHPDTGFGFYRSEGYHTYPDIYSKIDNFTTEIVLPINELDIVKIEELYDYLRYVSRINDRSTENISNLINKIIKSYDFCKKYNNIKFNKIPFKCNLPLPNIYNTKAEIYKKYENEKISSCDGKISCTIS